MASLKQIALHVSRDLRKNQTETEKIFWDHVKDKKILGYRFLRQHPLFYEYYSQEKFFITDFYCSELKLGVEIDGGIHEQQADYDNIRTEILETQKGLKVLRFKNDEVLHNIDEVLTELKKRIEQIIKMKSP